MRKTPQGEMTDLIGSFKAQIHAWLAAARVLSKKPTLGDKGRLYD